ncbi:MAG: enoyl-CoA hydratase/isomerase family protein [Thermoleophilia bacterium]|nr:enoyl-CoA hydratase/isomerase family protein [Thermoleophilia bacterium]
MACLAQDDAGTVRTLRLNRPEVRNALNLELLRALRAALAEAVSDPAVRCLLLTGEGKGFCAGADVKDWAEQGPQGGDDPWVAEAHALAVELAEAPLPTVALLNGAAVGAGLDLALACDFRVAADSARFACAYTWMAYPPDVGGTWLLPRLIGVEQAKRFVFTGELWDAATALERGLVGEVVPLERLAERGLELGTELATGPTVAIGHAKRLLDTSHRRSLAEQLEAERIAGEACALTDDHREALAAATERREPAFRGR